MNLFFTFPSILGLTLHVLIYNYYAKQQPLAGLSLPCMLTLTSLLYFYIMPAIMISTGIDNMFGMYLTTLEITHWLSILYLTGAITAFIKFDKQTWPPFDCENHVDGCFNKTVYIFLSILSFAMILVLFAAGQLNILRNESYEYADGANGMAFLYLGISMSIPLTLVYLVSDNFRIKSMAVFFAVLYLFMVAGFRFRILILLCAAAICFAVVKRIKLKAGRVFLASFGGMALMNLIGMVRKYGAGPNLDGLDDLDWTMLFSRFGGEGGMVFANQSAAENLPSPIYFDPYIIAAARYVPSFLWPDKPTPEYLTYITAGFLDQKAVAGAGIAATQHIEMLFQFGWLGPIALAFIYLSVITILNNKLSRFSGQSRIAGLSLERFRFGLSRLCGVHRALAG